MQIPDSAWVALLGVLGTIVTILFNRRFAVVDLAHQHLTTDYTRVINEKKELEGRVKTDGERLDQQNDQIDNLEKENRKLTRENEDLKKEMRDLKNIVRKLAELARKQGGNTREFDTLLKEMSD